MQLLRAVIRLDHQHAQILELHATEWKTRSIVSDTNHTHPQARDVRTDHEFFGKVCDALEALQEVIITGPHTAQDDFRHYVARHRRLLESHIVHWETVDHPSEGELVALARRIFLKRDRLSGATR